MSVFFEDTHTIDDDTTTLFVHHIIRQAARARARTHTKFTHVVWASAPALLRLLLARREPEPLALSLARRFREVCAPDDDDRLPHCFSVCARARLVTTLGASPTLPYALCGARI